MDRAERDLFRRSLRAAVEHHAGADLDEELLRLGWFEALRTEPRTAVAVLFELQGLLNATSSLDLVLASALCPEDPLRSVVLPAFGRHDPPAAEQRDGTIVVHGLGSRRLAGAAQVSVAIQSEAEPRLLTVATTELEVGPVRGLDPGLGLLGVDGVLEKLTPGASSPDAFWPSAVALAHLALAHELIGASRAMLGLARDHAVERVQFGRPIASFQAVRHRLADALVAVEAAAASVEAAWDERSVLSARAAKALAGRSAQVVAGHAQQVLAGLGFTAEHPLHRFVKRALALDQLFGSSASLTRSVGAELVEAGSLPGALAL